jgi:PilZ domain
MAIAKRHTAEIVHLRAGGAMPAADAGADAESRRAPRRRMLKAGVAAFQDRNCTIACTVRDLSATGARLRADGSVNIPDTFELIIELDGLEADCEVVWRRGIEIGVRFIGAARRTTPRRSQVVEAIRADTRPTIRRRPRGETE